MTKTSVDEVNPGKDDELVGLLGARMLFEATSVLLTYSNGIPPTEWPEIFMRAMIWTIDKAKDNRALRVKPTVARLRELCDIHLRGQQ